jgi:hypothetical protein
MRGKCTAITNTMYWPCMVHGAPQTAKLSGYCFIWLRYMLQRMPAKAFTIDVYTLRAVKIAARNPPVPQRV